MNFGNGVASQISSHWRRSMDPVAPLALKRWPLSQAAAKNGPPFFAARPSRSEWRCRQQVCGESGAVAFERPQAKQVAYRAAERSRLTLQVAVSSQAATWTRRRRAPHQREISFIIACYDGDGFPLSHSCNGKRAHSLLES